MAGWLAGWLAGNQSSTRGIKPNSATSQRGKLLKQNREKQEFLCLYVDNPPGTYF